MISRKTKGGVLVEALVFITISTVVLAGLVRWSIILIWAARSASNAVIAQQIAEAGIEYYRWHLAHAPSDFQDGTGHAGPYVHNFLDKDGNILGTFTLNIMAPPVGSTIVDIKSTGTVTKASGVKQSIEVKLAKPSLAKYAVVANDVMRFGAGTEIFGPIHSNNGIHFDGLAHNLVTSAVATYDDPDDAVGQVFGVHTDLTPVDSLPPAAVSARPDVFEDGRQFPVPAIDFSGFASNLQQMKTDAQSASGLYFPPSGYSAQGYHIVLKTNDTFDLYQVNTLMTAPSGCNSDGSDGWGTWSIASGGQTFLKNYAFPANGIIFLEDNAWVDGQINTARVTIAAASFPDNQSTRKSITVNSNLLYTNYDGRDVLSLVAQKNINAGLASASTLRIDGALIAENGRAGRYYYGSGCSPYSTMNTLTLFGMIATNLRYGFAYTDGTGYQTRNIVYDGNLLYAPPPSFPLLTDQYATISWKVVKN
jgi:hypothetical protein